MPPRWHSGLFVGALVVTLVVFLSSRGRARVAPSASAASAAQWRPDVVAIAASGSNATRGGRAGAGVVAAPSEPVPPPRSAAASPAVRERVDGCPLESMWQLRESAPISHAGRARRKTHPRHDAMCLLLRFGMTVAWCIDPEQRRCGGWSRGRGAVARAAAARRADGDAGGRGRGGRSSRQVLHKPN